MIQALFQNQDRGHDTEPSDDRTKRVDMPYRAWFASGIVAALLAIWSKTHYELFAKIAWTIAAPGFTLSQTWSLRHDFLSRIFFAIFLIVHFYLMLELFPHIPTGHFGYILLLAIAEIMTIGLMYQVWMRLRSEPSKHE